MENQQKEIFANCSQTHFAMRKFRRLISQCENSPTQIRNAKISQCEISQCQMPFRNAKFKIRNANSNFAMRKFRNAKISQCQIPFRNANFKFALPIPISQCENFAMRNFAMPKSISHCEIHCLCEIKICRPCHPM